MRRDFALLFKSQVISTTQRTYPELIKASTVAKGLEPETRTKALEVALKSSASIEEGCAMEMEIVAKDAVGVKESYQHVQTKLKGIKDNYDFICRDILHDKVFTSVQKPLPLFLNLMKSWDRFLKVRGSVPFYWFICN